MLREQETKTSQLKVGFKRGVELALKTLDDALFLQSIIDNTPPEETVTFPAGVYNISEPLSFDGRGTVDGNGSTLYYDGAYCMGFRNCEKINIDISNLTFINRERSSTLAFGERINK